jgi:putative methionine-R-sulfoxide reductase with GAF domain
VARGTLNDTSLQIIAASGPVSEHVKGLTIPFGQGIVGLCFDMGFSIQVDDVSRHKSHLAKVDSQTGFLTRATLCVPIRDDSHRMFGVIQLINPKSDFLDWHIECAETVARTLSGPLAAA